MGLSLKFSVCMRALVLASAGLTVAALAVAPAQASILYADTDTTLYTVDEGTGTLTQAATGFVNARGIAVDSNGAVYVADYDTGAGTLGSVYSVSGGTATPLITGLTGPYGLQINASGNLVVSTNNGFVNTYSTSGGAPLSSVNVGGNLTDLGTAANGHQLVSSRSAGTVIDVTANSVFASLGTTASANGPLTDATRGITTANGVMYVDESTGTNGGGFSSTGTIFELDPTTGAQIATLYTDAANGAEGNVYDPSTGRIYYGAVGDGNSPGVYDFDPLNPGSSATLLTLGATAQFHDVALANVPEPMSLTVVGSALIGLAGARRFRSRRAS